MYYSKRAQAQMDKWRKEGKFAFLYGMPLEKNPYKGALAAQMWAEGWGNALADAQPLPAADD